MAKKHQSRPSAAARKKYEEQKQAQRIASRKKFVQQYKKQLIIGCAALVAAIIVIVLAVDFFYTPNGSMRVFMGNLMGVSETSVVREIDGLYYEMAHMKNPEGYTAQPYELFSGGDANERNRYFETEDESKAIHSVYVAGVKEKSGEEMIQTVLSQAASYVFQSEAKQAEIAGHQVRYLYTQNAASDEDPSLMTSGLVMYVDTIADSCVLINCLSAKGAQDSLPAEEALMAEMEAILACLSVPGK